MATSIHSLCGRDTELNNYNNLALYAAFGNFTSVLERRERCPKAIPVSWLPCRRTRCLLAPPPRRLIRIGLDPLTATGRALARITPASTARPSCAARAPAPQAGGSGPESINRSTRRISLGGRAIPQDSSAAKHAYQKAGLYPKRGPNPKPKPTGRIGP